MKKSDFWMLMVMIFLSPHLGIKLAVIGAAISVMMQTVYALNKN